MLRTDDGLSHAQHLKLGLYLHFLIVSCANITKHQDTNEVKMDSLLESHGL